ncbi:MAG: ribonuclease P protein component [Bacteroidetes bacterium]|nr:ribonuclease P protein component [Bacteroidota bacterium]
MQTFTKAERLSSKIEIENLFGTGKSFNSAPFKVIWLKKSDGTAPAKIVISIPKRLFKRAVDRNRLKRLTREAYRKNKHLLYDNIENEKIHLMFIFTSKTIIEYKEMEEKVISILQRLIKTINP